MAYWCGVSEVVLEKEYGMRRSTILSSVGKRAPRMKPLLGRGGFG